MMKLAKCALFAMAATAISPVFAQGSQGEVELEEEDLSVGWTPIALGVASPVQLPWGSHKWDVFGLDLGIIWADNPKMYGLGIAGIAMATRDEMRGVQLSALCNWASKDVSGMRVTLGGNFCYGNTYGVDVGLFGYRTGEVWGWDTEFVGSYQPKAWGLQIAGIANVCSEQSYGCSVAIGTNWAPVSYGCDVAALFNYTTELHGCQIGLVNYARECAWGFQIGLINIIMDNSWKVLPIVNGYF